MIPIINAGGTAIPDEGVYSAQAQNLSNGSWAGPRAAPDIDPDGDFDGMAPQAIIGDQSIPYSRHALYPLVLTPALALGGTNGMLVLSVLGTWAAAVGAALLTSRIDKQLAIPALWLVGVGSPLIFGAYLVVAQSLAAAATAFTVLLALRYTEGRRTLDLVGALVTAVLATMLRSEGLVVMLAVGLVFCLTPLPSLFRVRSPRGDRSLLLPALVGLLVAAAATLAHLLDRRIDAAIVGQESALLATDLVLSERTDPIRSTLIAWLQPWSTGLDATPAALLILMSAAASALALRVMKGRTFAGVALTGLGAVSAVWLVFSDSFFIAGLLATWPVAVFGLLSLRSSALREPLVAQILGLSLLTLIGVALTSYADGGAAQWGGRFFHVLIPLLAVPALVGTRSAVSPLDKRQVQTIIGCLAVMTLCLSFVSLRLNYRNRSATDSIMHQTTQEATSTESGSPQPLVLVAQMFNDGIARTFWSNRGEVAVLNARHLSQVFSLLSRSAEHGRGRVVVLSQSDSDTVEYFAGDALDELGWHRKSDTLIDGTVYRIIVYEPEP